MIAAATPRDVFADHDAACPACRELYGYARQRGDRGALDAWRSQLAAHLVAAAERQQYDRDVRAWLAAAYSRPACGAGVRV